MNKDIFKKAFADVKPSEELVNSVLEFQNAPAARKKTKGCGFSGKRVFGTAAAVVAVLICGISVAAATGLIDFEAVFGKYITVKDSELADSLVGTVSNFKYKVSDKDYKVEIKGVTGDDKNIMVAAEISRKDGTPVTDCFVNPIPPDERQLLPLWQNADVNVKTETSYSYSMNYGINESGCIEFFIELNGVVSDGINGSKMNFKGENFYPAGKYIDFKYNNPNEAAYTEYTYTQVRESVEKSGSNVPTSLDDILALDLEWEFSFKYTASDKSRQVKSLNEPKESFPLAVEVRKFKSDEKFVIERIAQPSCIEAGSTGGRVDFEYEITGYEHNRDYITDFTETAEVYIITKDGERIRSYLDGGSIFPDGDVCICSFRLTYWDKDYKIFIDVGDIKAISINGTVYELN